MVQGLSRAGALIAPQAFSRPHVAGLSRSAEFAHPARWGAGAMTMPCDDAGTKGAQRFEIFTGAGKRRTWPPEVKASIVAESYSGVETVCAVARRHGLAPSQLFAWRREVRQQLTDQGLRLPIAPASGSSFVPAVIEPAASAEPVAPARRPRRLRRSQPCVVELEIDGVAVKIARGADAPVIAAVIEALKAAR